MVPNALCPTVDPGSRPPLARLPGRSRWSALLLAALLMPVAPMAELRAPAPAPAPAPAATPGAAETCRAPLAQLLADREQAERCVVDTDLLEALDAMRAHEVAPPPAAAGLPRR